MTAPPAAAVGVVVHLHLLVGGVTAGSGGCWMAMWPRSWARPRMLTFSMASTESGKRVRMSILIACHPLPHMDLHRGLRSRSTDWMNTPVTAGIRYSRGAPAQCRPCGPDRGPRRVSSPSGLAGVGVADRPGPAARRQSTAPSGRWASARRMYRSWSLQGQSGVHVVHAGELHQHQALVDVVGRGGTGRPSR